MHEAWLFAVTRLVNFFCHSLEDFKKRRVRYEGQSRHDAIGGKRQFLSPPALSAPDLRQSLFHT